MAVETAVSALRRALDHLRQGGSRGAPNATRGGSRGEGRGEGSYSVACCSAASAEAAAPAHPPASTPAARQWWLRVAQWAAALVWLLSYDDDNCHRALRAAGQLLVALASGEGASSLESGVIQTMAMGTVVRHSASQLARVTHHVVRSRST